MTDGRQVMLELLRDTGEEFAAAAAAIPGTAWEQRPSHGGWTPSDVVEHLTLVEVSTGKLVARKLFAEEAPEPLRAATAGKDDLILSRVADRGIRVEAPDFVRPSRRWSDATEMVTAFRTARATIVAALGDPARDLSRYVALHPILGPFDARQWGLFLAMHVRRHLLQLEEILSALEHPPGR